MVFTSLNLIALLGCLVIWLSLMFLIEVKGLNFYKDIGIKNFGKLFLNFIVDTLNWFTTIIPD